VGARGLLRAIHPLFERVSVKVAQMLGKPLSEDIIAWSYMDLLERSTKQIKLSVSHKTLSELHPADIADIIEQLDPRLRTQVFAQLDTEQAAEAITELDDDELMTEMLEVLSDREASTMLATMDPDDAAALIEELDYEKAEKLLRLMGVKEEKAIRNLLGYEEDTAGRIMTNQFVALPATATVQDAIDALRGLDEDFESIYYVYTTDVEGALTGVLSMRSLVVAEHTDRLKDLAYRDVVWVAPDLDQELVADEMTKYDLVAIPVCDENRHILGIVTVDDALDVIAEEHAEDLQIAGVSVSENNAGESTHAFSWFAQRQYWVLVWAIAACAIAAIVVPGLSGIDTGYMGMGEEDARQLVTGYGMLALMPISIMPIVLMASMRMVSFVKNSYLEYDERDDEPKPYLGFFIKTTLIGLVLAVVVYLCGELMVTTLFAESVTAEAATYLACFRNAGVVIAGTYMSAVIYFYILFRSDEKDQNISGTSLTFAAVLLSALAYTFLGAMPLL
jgi:magnesium transporter